MSTREALVIGTVVLIDPVFTAAFEIEDIIYNKVRSLLKRFNEGLVHYDFQ